MTLYYGVTIFSFVSLVISVIIGILIFSKLPKDQKWFFGYLGFILIVEITAKVLILLGEKNWVVYPIYLLGEFLLLAFMCSEALKWSAKLNSVWIGISVLLLFECLVLWGVNSNVVGGLGKIVSHFIIIGLTGIYLIQKLKEEDRLQENRFMVTYASLFFYYTISLFLFLILEQLPGIGDEQAAMVWSLNNLFSALLYGISGHTFFKIWKST